MGVLRTPTGFSAPILMITKEGLKIAVDDNRKHLITSAKTTN
jgi:hypothetical protein